MEPEPPDLSDSGTPWQLGLIGVALYVIVIICTWRLFNLYDQGADLGKAVLPALGAIAVPLFAISLVAVLPQYYCFGQREAGSSQFQVGWIVLIPGYALHLTLRGQFELVSWWALILVGLTGGFILANLISHVRFGIMNFVGIVGFASAYVGGAVLFINCMFDYRPVEVATQRHAVARSPGSFAVKLKHARPHGLAQLNLNSFSFNFRDTRDGVCVRVYRGALFLSWYTVDPYMDCPGANPRLDDVMFRKAELCSAGYQHGCLALAKFKAGKFTADELAMEWAEIACFKGAAQECALLCARGRKYVSCANQEWRFSGRDWTVYTRTSGFGLDGRYQAQLGISCTVSLTAPTRPALNTVQHLIDYDGEQFRGPVSKRMHNTLGEALREVCAAAPEPYRKLSDPSQFRGYQDERPFQARETPVKTLVHKCQGADGKIMLTDADCPKGQEQR